MRSIVLWMIIIGMALLIYVGQQIESIRIASKIEELKTRIKEIESENNNLLARYNYLTSRSQIKKIATEKLGMVEPKDEDVVKIYIK
jgi:cell division protein FtsL